MMHDKLEFLEELKTLRKTRYNPELSDNIDSLIAKYEVEVEEIEKTYKWVEDNEEFKNYLGDLLSFIINNKFDNEEYVTNENTIDSSID